MDFWEAQTGAVNITEHIIKCAGGPPRRPDIAIRAKAIFAKQSGVVRTGKDALPFMLGTKAAFLHCI